MQADLILRHLVNAKLTARLHLILEHHAFQGAADRRLDGIWANPRGPSNDERCFTRGFGADYDELPYVVVDA
jgi:hypothetical protein